MRQHRARNDLRRGHHTRDVHSQDAVAYIGGVSESGRFVLNSGCGNEAVETGVLVGDAGDESVQRGDVDNVDGVVGQCSFGERGS